MFLRTIIITHFIYYSFGLILPRVPQRVTITEPNTGVTVTLVGTMHYNPTSIALARNTVHELGQTNSLHSVVIESCPSRWTKALASQPPGSIMSKLFANEMMSASDAANEFNCPIILGDQNFNDTTRRMKEVFIDSLKDIANPTEGWKRLYSDISTLSSKVLATGDNNFGPSDLFDPALLAKAPLSILRYSAAILIKAPKLGFPIFALFIYSVLQSSAADSASIDIAGDANVDFILDSIFTLVTYVLQIALLGRVTLQALLHERNEILANNILTECKAAKNGKTVVAILGMAHCNGVKDLLLSAPK